MPVYCFVERCHSTRYISKNRLKNEKTVTFFRFPTAPELRNKWITAICTLNKQYINNIPKTASICEKHFEGCLQKNGFSIRLIRDAVPSVFPNIAEQSNSPEISDPIFIDVNAIDIAQVEYVIPNDVHTSFPRKDTQTPIKDIADSSNKLREEKLEELTSRRLVKYITTLKTIINEKNVIIKRLRLKGSRQKKRINRLKTLLEDLF